MSPRGNGKFLWRIGSKPNYPPPDEKPEGRGDPDPIAKAVFGSRGAGSGGQFDTVGAPMIGVNLDSKRIVSWNKAAVDLFGFSRQEALQMWVEDLLPGKLQARFRADLTAFRINGRSRYIEPTRAVQIPMVRKDGEKLFVSILVTPLNDSEAGSQHILGLVRDTSARTSSGVDDDFDEVVRSPNEAIIFSDCDGVLMHWSPAAEKLFGHRVSDTLGKQLATLLPADTSALQGEVLSASMQGRTHTVDPLVLMRKDGGTFKGVMEAFPILENDGECTGVVLVFKEIGADVTVSEVETELGSNTMLEDVRRSEIS